MICPANGGESGRRSLTKGVFKILMAKPKSLIDELKTYKSICFYPSCGTDLGDIDYFCSGRRPIEERKNTNVPENCTWEIEEPDVYIHTDVNFYMEFESGEDFDLSECGIHGKYEILSFEQLETFDKPNRINGNFPYSGQCFKYTLKVWGKEKPITLIFCLCENEYAASQIFMANNIDVKYVWSKNWNGGRTYGPWLAKAAKNMGVKFFYTDWLCLPGFRGEPSNSIVYEKYPELNVKEISKLERTDNHWIEEGAHGWVDEFKVR